MRVLPGLVGAAALLSAPPLAARTWYVTPDGTGDAPTIQAAVESTATGDTVLVAAGTYFEEVVLASDIALVSESGPEATTISAAGGRRSCLWSDEPLANLVVEGFTLTGVEQYVPPPCGREALYLRGGPITLRDCIVENNDSGEGAGTAELVGQILVEGCVFRNNSAGYSCGAIDPGEGAGCAIVGQAVTFDGCVLESNWGGTEGVAQMAVPTALVLRDCVIRGNFSLYYPYSAFSVYYGSGSFLTIEDCLLVDNEGSLLGAYTDWPLVQITGSTFVHNRHFFTDPPPFALGSSVRYSVFTDANVGLSLPNGGAGMAVLCNDSWGNGTDWEGFDPDLFPGNFSLDPRFCDSAQDDYSVASDSPLLPESVHNECGVLIGALGEGCASPVGAVEAGAGAVTALQLARPDPNPTSGAAAIRFALPAAVRIDLAVFDVGGRRVAALAGGVLESGWHERTWSGRDDRGRRVAPGVYFVRLEAAGEVRTRKVVRAGE